MMYKGKAVSVQQVGRDLGVRYVLEGSIQTSGDHVRVTAQLIEAATDAHVWSERYDRPLQEFFDVQSEVTQKIAATLGSSGVLFSEAAIAKRKPPASLQAYDYYVLAFELENGRRIRRKRTGSKPKSCSRRPSNWTRSSLALTCCWQPSTMRRAGGRKVRFPCFGSLKMRF